MTPLDELTPLRTYQQEALDAILRRPLCAGQRYLLQFAAGTGASVVVQALIRTLQQRAPALRLLLLTHTKAEQNQYDAKLHRIVPCATQDPHRGTVFLSTYSQMAAVLQREETRPVFGCVICIDPQHADSLRLLEQYRDACLIGFTREALNAKGGIFSDAPLIYSYSLRDAARDGYLQSIPDPRLRAAALDGFCMRLLSRYGRWDDTNTFLLHTENGVILVEAKSYQDRQLPIPVLEAAKKQILRFAAHASKAIPLLLLFGEAPVGYKEAAYRRHKLTIWDIGNLLYYAGDDDALLRELTRLMPFSLSDIQPQPSCGWTPAPVPTERRPADPEHVTDTLQQRLERCKTGPVFAREYEQVCTDIIQHLFGDAFSLVSNQHKTKDALFRMDLLCSMKGEGAFWALLKHHYNSRYIVFEFKNYGKPLEQNLIFITEKYLFNAALRNVAIIVSRRGFSKNAAEAAAGCLKENGKLILDVTDKDLQIMLQRKAAGLESADYLLEKLDALLMSISK